MTQNNERRRAPRVDLVGQVRGELAVPIRLREISLGGMSFESTEAFVVDSRQSFVLTLGDGAGVAVVGRVVYSRKVAHSADPMFITGIQFLDEDSGDAGGDVGKILRSVQ